MLDRIRVVRRRLQQAAKAFLADFARGLVPAVGDGEGEAVRRALQKRHAFWREAIRLLVVELDETEGLLSHSQRNERHGFVAFAVAVVSDSLPVRMIGEKV